MNGFESSDVAVMPSRTSSDTAAGRAKQVCEVVWRQIAELERELTDGEALAIRIPLGDGRSLEALWLAPEGDLVIAHGVDTHGHETRAIVSPSVLRVVLSRVRQGSLAAGAVRGAHRRGGMRDAD